MCKTVTHVNASADCPPVIFSSVICSPNMLKLFCPQALHVSCVTAIEYEHVDQEVRKVKACFFLAAVDRLVFTYLRVCLGLVWYLLLIRRIAVLWCAWQSVLQVAVGGSGASEVGNLPLLPLDKQLPSATRTRVLAVQIGCRHKPHEDHERTSPTMTCHIHSMPALHKHVLMQQAAPISQAAALNVGQSSNSTRREQQPGTGDFVCRLRGGLCLHISQRPLARGCFARFC